MVDGRQARRGFPESLGVLSQSFGRMIAYRRRTKGGINFEKEFDYT